VGAARFGDELHPWRPARVPSIAARPPPSCPPDPQHRVPRATAVPLALLPRSPGISPALAPSPGSLRLGQGRPQSTTSRSDRRVPLRIQRTGIRSPRHPTRPFSGVPHRRCGGMATQAQSSCSFALLQFSWRFILPMAAMAPMPSTTGLCPPRPPLR
jgi:hypothetical protein